MNFKNKIMKSVLFVAISMMMQIYTTSVFAASSPYTWSNVAIGGGGYTTGIIIHPKEPDLMYARSDVGGMFRWDAQEKKWKQLMNTLGYEKRNSYGIDGMAIDPNNPDILYVAAGKAWNRTGDVLKSTDRGETWQETNLKKKFYGNGQWRYTGELIAVDPVNSDIIYVGTRADGLYKSLDGAKTWQQVAGVPAGEVVPPEEMPLMTQFDYPIGTRSVVFDPTSGKNGISQIIYASVVGKGIYQTKDAGQTWVLMSESPTLAGRMEAADNGALYVTTLGQGVKKYHNGIWTDITPPDSDLRYCGLSVDPNNSDNIIVSRWANTDNPIQLPIYRSKNGGASWELVSTTTADNCKFAPAWFPPWFFLASTSQVIFDPHHQGVVFAADWYSVWKTPDIWANPSNATQWYAQSDGLENTCILTLATLPSGSNLLSGGADYGGHSHSDINSFPEGELIRTMGNMNSIDFCEANPDYVAATGSRFHDSNGVFVISDDNGKTFTKIKTPDGCRNGRVAYSATNTNHIVWVPQSGTPIVTTDRGNTWSETTGAPTDTVTDFWLTNQPLAADKVNGNTFYLLRAPDNENNEFYRSTDGGATWHLINNTQLGKADPWFWPQVKTAPGMEGEVWVTQSEDGLYRSSDGGNTFNKVLHVQTARLVAFGKNPPGKSHPAVFVQGKVNGIDDGVFRSDDMGQTWIQINDSSSMIGNIPNSMEGDRQIFGRVYIGTNGSGIYYGDAVTDAVMYDDFASNKILSYTNSTASVENGMLKMPEGAVISGIKLPKNSSVEFDIKASTVDGLGRLYADVRKNCDNESEFYRIIYANFADSLNTGFSIEKHTDDSAIEIASITDSDKYALSTQKSMHIKYVTFEDRAGIYFNGKLIKTVTLDNWEIPFELSVVNEEINDEHNHEIYIDNLRINKVNLAECEELYSEQAFDGEFIDELTFHKNDGTIITGAEALYNGIYTLRTRVNNPTKNDKTADMCVGIYQEDVLVDISIVNVIAPAGAYNQVIEVPFKPDYTKLDAKKAVRLKGFMLDSINNIKPLTSKAIVSDLSVSENEFPVIHHYNFNNEHLPAEFDAKNFSVVNNQLKANGAGSKFSFFAMPKDCSIEFKIRPVENERIPKFNVQIGNGSFTYYDNNSENSTWSDRFFLYNSVTWGDAVSSKWANETFFPDTINGHTLRYDADGDTHSMYIDNTLIFSGECVGTSDSYDVIFTINEDAKNGLYLDDITVKYLNKD